MAEVKRTVTTTQDEGVTDQGAQVRQQTQQINTESAVDKKSTAVSLVWFLVGLIEILLAFRFFLKLFGANPLNGFVDFIYSITNTLTAPFDSIFGVVHGQGKLGSVFEPSIIVAAAVYALLGWGITKLININRK